MFKFQEATNLSQKGTSPTKEPSPPGRNSAEFHEIEGSMKAVKSIERFSSQSSNSLQSINSILSDEANASMLSYSSAVPNAKNSRPDSIPGTESEVSKQPTIEIDVPNENKISDKEANIESASQSLTDILDNVRPPRLLPPAASRDYARPVSPRSYHGSQESLAESIKSMNKAIASNPDLAGPMNRLPGGRGLQKHVDVSRIDLERQQKVIFRLIYI